MSIHNDIRDATLFNDKLDDTLSRDIFYDYAGMISEFLSRVIENINIRDTTHFLFIVKRGLDTLKHCFNLIYLYTKNHTMAIHHCRRGFCYYVEFMGQICEDGNSYLQLNSKDAVLFVYKKTIYDINQDQMREHTLNTGEKEMLQLVSMNINIFNSVIENTLYLMEDDIDKRGDIIKRTVDKSFKVCSKLNSNIKESEMVLAFVTTINTLITDCDKYSELCHGFIKKYQKKNIDKGALHRKLYSHECELKLRELSTLRFINWVYSPEL